MVFLMSIHGRATIVNLFLSRDSRSPLSCVLLFLLLLPLSSFYLFLIFFYIPRIYITRTLRWDDVANFNGRFFRFERVLMRNSLSPKGLRERESLVSLRATFDRARVLSYFFLFFLPTISVYLSLCLSFDGERQDQICHDASLANLGT